MKTAQPIEFNSATYQRFIRSLSPRNRLAWDYAVETGLRVSDIINLRSAAIAETMTVHETKTGKTRTVTISPDMVVRLREYAIRHRRSPWVFASPHDQTRHITRDTLNKAIRTAARACDISGIVSMHSARKIYAIQLYRRTGSYEAVRQALNHKYIGTSLAYLFAADPIR